MRYSTMNPPSPPRSFLCQVSLQKSPSLFLKAPSPLLMNSTDCPRLGAEETNHGRICLSTDMQNMCSNTAKI